MTQASPVTDGHFTAPIGEADPAVANAISAELQRQRDVIELVASENMVSRAVLEAQGSILTNRTVEGYPGARYYNGVVNIDVLESLAIERACRLFGSKFANVQPHSGSQANQAVLLACAKPGDTILGMALFAGGHLTHGAPWSMTGQVFNAIGYGVRREDGRIDPDEVERLAREHRPKVIIAGGSAYPRQIDFARFRAIADAVGAKLLVDMAHFAGLVAGGAHPNPVPHADVVTTTTYKSLRGPRGAIILTNDARLAKRIDNALFPGMQGSAMLHAVAGKAVCLGEALQPAFREHAAAVLANARMLAATLAARGFDLVAGGTDTPLMLVDLRRQGIKGNVAAESLDRAGITCNKNNIPFDQEDPTVASGLRFGVSAGTSRGFRTAEFETIGRLIADVLDGLARQRNDNAATEAGVAARVRDLTQRFPIYPTLKAAAR